MLRPGQVVALCVIALLTVGVVMVNSAGMTVLAEGVTPKAILLSRSTIYMALAVAAMFAASRLPVRRLAGYFGEADQALVRPNAPILGGLTFLISPMVLFIVLLALVYAPVIGKEVNGAHRWIRLPIPGLGDALSVQPSEIVKWAMTGVIAWYCCRRSPVIHQFWRGLVPALAFAGAVSVFIVLADLGTGALVLAASCIVLLAAGARFWQFMMFVPLGLAGLGLAIFKSPYRVQRVLAFLDPYADPEKSGYHMIQSMSAVAGGEVFGRGLGHGQQKFGYLPEDETDFLFAIVCEELGVAGAAAVIGVLLLLIWTGLGIVKRQRDSFLRLMGIGIIATIGLQAIINLAVVTGMAPTKGIALPLVSRGGSGWILTAFSLGLLWAIDRTQSRSLLAGDDEPAIETPSAPFAGGVMTVDRSNRAFVLAGGGTGGHIFPNLAIAEQLESLLGHRPRCVFAVSRRPLDAQILKDESREFEAIPAEPLALRPRGLLKFLNSWGRSVRAARALIQKLKREHGQVDVVATGGFVSAPVAQAARVERVPVTLVNLDATPGRANRWIARHAARVFTAAETPSVNWPVIRPIVRAAALAPGDARMCRKKLGLDPDRPVLLVTGASQGAGSINKLLVAMIEKHAADFASRGWQVIHQTGPRTGAKDMDDSRAAMKSAGIPAVVEPFFREMGVAWGAADLAISRSGAGSVAEAWANATPSVFLPYPYHKDQHQRANAAALVRAGACVIEDDLVDAEQNLAHAGAAVLSLMRDDAKRDAMKSALKSLGPADGAMAVATALLDVR